MREETRPMEEHCRRFEVAAEKRPESIRTSSLADAPAG
jgi:hypothetical protein